MEIKTIFLAGNQDNTVKVRCFGILFQPGVEESKSIAREKFNLVEKDYNHIDTGALRHMVANALSRMHTEMAFDIRGDLSGDLYPELEKAIFDIVGVRPFLFSYSVKSGQSSPQFKTKCPFCGNDEDFEHINYQGTYIWVCKPCPNIMFEYYTDSDLENLNCYLKKGNENNSCETPRSNNNA